MVGGDRRVEIQHCYCVASSGLLPLVTDYKHAELMSTPALPLSCTGEIHTALLRKDKQPIDNRKVLNGKGSLRVRLLCHLHAVANGYGSNKG